MTRRRKIEPTEQDWKDWMQDVIAHPWCRRPLYLGVQRKELNDAPMQRRRLYGAGEVQGPMQSSLPQAPPLWRSDDNDKN